MQNIIELDESRANPYYIKAFFDSEQGIAALKSITVGATIPNIGVDKLKNVMIPLPSSLIKVVIFSISRSESIAYSGKTMLYFAAK